jgi:hypothetical protein
MLSDRGKGGRGARSSNQISSQSSIIVCWPCWGAQSINGVDSKVKSLDPRVPRSPWEKPAEGGGAGGRDQITISGAVPACVCAAQFTLHSRADMRVVAGCPTNPSPKAEHALGPQVQACMVLEH